MAHLAGIEWGPRVLVTLTVACAVSAGVGVSANEAAQVEVPSANAGAPTSSYIGSADEAPTTEAGCVFESRDVEARPMRHLHLPRTAPTPASESGLGEPDSHSWDFSLSPDGRYVGFYSEASNLVAGDSNGATDVFVRDRLTGSTDLISVSTGGQQASDNSYWGDVSANGRWISFCSDATDLVPDDTNSAHDLFVRDRLAGTTERVSVAVDGSQANALSDYAQISDDGTVVSFFSAATNLVDDDTNYYLDVFVRDRVGGTTERVSVATDGTEADGGSDYPSISADGRYVAFPSVATNLVPEDTNYAMDIFVHDRETGVTERVSISSEGAQGDSLSDYPSISADGRYVAFDSNARNLVPGDTNDMMDVFVHDRETGVTERVSISSEGAQGDEWSYSPAVSADGRYVAFGSTATNLVPGDTNGSDDVFVHDRETGVTERVSLSSGGLQPNNHSWMESVSVTPRYVVFSSSASNLVPDDMNGSDDVFIRDRSSGTTSRISLAQTEGDILGDWDVRLRKPVVLLLNGIHNNGDGEMAGLRDILDDRDWIEGVAIVPSNVYEPDRTLIDSAGGLDEQVERLMNYCVSHRVIQVQSHGSSHPVYLDDHVIILVGQSYGGVIERGLVSDATWSRFIKTGLADNILGVVQLGSPNEGSLVARALNHPNGLDQVVKDVSLFYTSNGTYCLDPAWMKDWNARNQVARRPVYRIAGNYLPGALNDAAGSQYEIEPLGDYARLSYLNSKLDRASSDGFVAVNSVRGSGEWFGGAPCDTEEYAKHGADIPGESLYFDGPVFDISPARYKIRDYPSLVPNNSSHPVLDTLLNRIANIWHSGGVVYQGASQASDKMLAESISATAEVEGTDQQGSRNLPLRRVVLNSGQTATDTVLLDGNPTLFQIAGEGAEPEVAITGPGGELDVSWDRWDGADDVYVAQALVEPQIAGPYEIQLSLGGTEGTVTVDAVAHGGPTCSIEVLNLPIAVGEQCTVQTLLREDDGQPALESAALATLSCGEYQVEVPLADDGVAPDELADDGIYSGSAAVLGDPGAWTARVAAYGDDFEREDLCVFDVGSTNWAAIESVEETVTKGDSGLVSRWAVDADVDVLEDGAYVLEASVHDSDGALVAQPSVEVTLSAGSQSLSAAIEANHLAGISPGPVLVDDIRLYRRTTAGLLVADSASGFMTDTYAPGDFEAFGVSLTPQFSTPTSALATFLGQSVCTSSSVGEVEYSLDDGVTWSAAAPSDGVFDTAFESFEFSLEPADGVYGVLVRCISADGRELPADDWAAMRFVIDSQAPEEVGPFSCIPNLGGDGVYNLTWTSPEESSQMRADLQFHVAVDGVPVGSTYGESYEVVLQEGAHSVSVRPVDEAGNAGPISTVMIYVDVYEPDDTWSQGTPIVPNGSTQFHLIDPDSDADWLVFESVPGHWYEIAASETDPSDETDTDLRLYDALGTSLREWNDDANLAGRFRVTDTRYSRVLHRAFDTTLTAEIRLGGAMGAQTGPYEASVTDLGTSGSITGTVEGPFGPVVGADIMTYVDDGYGGWELAAHVRGATGADGAYEVTGLCPGAHRVLAIDTSDLHFDEFYGGAQDPDIWNASSVSVASGGQVTGIDMQLDLKDTVAPSVTDDHQATYAGTAEIHLVADDNDEVGSVSYKLDGASAYTKVDGDAATVTVDELGEHSLTYFATDISRNSSAPKTVQFSVEDFIDLPDGFFGVAGATRYETAIEASKRAYPDGAGTVVIATGANWPDALGGAALAGVVEGPLLLTTTNTLPDAVLAEVKRLEASDAYILGGTAAVGPTVENTLRATLSGDVTRLAGANRYGTANTVADEVISLSEDSPDGFAGNAFIATGANFPDALGASPLAASSGTPILLAPTGGTPYLPAAVDSAVILGGTGAVTSATESAVKSALEDANVTRVGGTDRYDTAALVADYGVDSGMRWDGVGIATGAAFPDALSGGAMLGSFDSVLLLTRPTSLAPVAEQRLSANKDAIDTVFFIGGTGAVSQTVRDRVAQVLQ